MSFEDLRGSDHPDEAMVERLQGVHSSILEHLHALQEAMAAAKAQGVIKNEQLPATPASQEAGQDTDA